MDAYTVPILPTVLYRFVNTNLFAHRNFTVPDPNASKHSGPGQAMLIVDELKTMWSSDEMDENEMDSVMQALQEAYWESKRRRK